MANLTSHVVDALVQARTNRVSMGVPDQAIGAIIAASITGIVAWLGLIISKESKISEFRQQWVDALRSDIAAVVKHGHCISMSTAVVQSGNEHPWNRIGQDFAGLTEAVARIRLRLNAKEKESAALLSVLNHHLLAVKQMVRNNDDTDEAGLQEAVSLASDNLIAAAQIVLKQEWRRVRSGEFTYKAAKSAAVLAVAVCFFVLMYRFLRG